MSKQRMREPTGFPKINIKNVYNNINDYKVEDFEIIDYIHTGTIQMKMIT
jgi:thymidylate synthase